MNKFFFIVFFVGLWACGTNRSEEKIAVETKESQLHFSVKQEAYYTILMVNTPFSNLEKQEKYVLYPRDSMPPKVEDATHIIPVPLKRVAITSTTHLGFLEALGQSESIVAVTNPELFYSTKFQQRIADGMVRSIGRRSIETEVLIDTEVEVVFSYAIDGASYEEAKHLRDLGQKVVLVSEFMEKSPLNKSSWMSFFDPFYYSPGKGRARTLQEAVQHRYDSIVERCAKLKDSPTVMIGFPWRGTWYVSGGDSFQATYFKDAHVNYVWAEATQEEEGSIPLTVEQVINDAMNADFWINPGAQQSLSGIKDFDERLASFAAFKRQKIYSNYKRTNEEGANDYWESAVVHPDIVLADLVSIFHPEVGGERELVYFKRLED
jgi:iron complex transport system substrate-binding protein